MSTDNFKPQLSYFRQLIDQLLNGQRIVPKGFLAATLKENDVFNLDNNQFLRILKHLETVYSTQQENGHILKTDFKEWYAKEKKLIDFHYWSRLEAYWRQDSVLPIEVIRSVDDVTDEIMGFLGNPKDKESWNRRRGLVMGHVQMGKTTNYSALISKAADAGYRIIIVLAGLTNSLRYQTQVRLDQTFVGKSSVSDATHTKYYRVSSIFAADKDYKAKYPFCGTTQLSDFNTATARAVGAHQGSFADPILFVTKKNPKVLEKLTDWLKGLNPGQKLDGPMLLIDDEADNASVNTNIDTQQATAINLAIRMLLDTTRQTTYIGYTATPFANIFIDPDSANDMAKEDLFPADFIKSLDPPTNYVGSQRLFTEDGDLRGDCIRVIQNDYQDILPLNHKSSHKVFQLPESLKTALSEYIIFRALRIAMGDKNSHSAMLINVSRFNSVQQQIKDLVETYINNNAQAIQAWSKADWNSSHVMKDLYKVWATEFSEVEKITWNEILEHLNEAVSSIQPKLINMKGSGVDYEKATRSGQHIHIVAIGGLALARGLTLEGLSVSYVLRNVGAADTLLQLGRWFGYRPGFEKICRIHATQDLIDDFASVSESVEELRSDFERMSLLGKTPYEFGLKVRQSATGIAITAANKMRSATTISLAEDFSTRHIQAHSLYDDDIKNKKNLTVVLQLNEFLKNNYSTHYEHNLERNATVWKKIPAKYILETLKSLDFPQNEFSDLTSDGGGLLTSYIQDRSDSELATWDIAIPFIKMIKKDAKPIKFPLISESQTYCRSREGTVRLSNSIIKVNKQNAIAFGHNDFFLGEEEIEYKLRIDKIKRLYQEKNPKGSAPSETWAHSVARSRPLLIIHFLQLIPPTDFEKPLTYSKDIPVVSVGVLLPGTKIPCIEKKYRASRRLIEMINQIKDTSDTDEEIFFE